MDAEERKKREAAKNQGRITAFTIKSTWKS